MRLLLAASIVLAGCATTKSAEPKRTLPEPLVAAALPDRPDAVRIPAVADWVIAVEAGDTVPDGRAGILMSSEKAARAARYVVDYNELRQLYEVDLRTWGRERAIYERHLEAAEREIETQRQRAERSWWERNDGTIGIVAGIVIGVAASAAAAKAIDAAAK